MITIRPYSPDDRASCLALFNSNVPGFFDTVELALFEHFLDALERKEPGKPSSRDEHYFVMDKDGHILGCGGVCLREDKNAACMAWGMVDNALHKQGFGSELLKFRIEKMEELFPGVPVELDTTQHSYGFFQKFGFNTTKITDNFYAPGMHRYDMIKEG